MEKNTKNNTYIIWITESLCCISETNIHCNSTILQLKKKFLKVICHVSQKSLALSLLGQMHGKANYYIVK